MAAAYVQNNAAKSIGTTATSYAVPITTSAGAGHRLIVWVRAGASIISTVTDTQGNTWVTDANDGGGAGTRISAATTPQDIAPLTTLDTITINMSATATAAITVEEYSGLATSITSILDGTPGSAHGTATGTLPTVSVITTVDGSMILTGVVDAATNAVFTVPSGFNGRTEQGNTGSVQSADQLSTTAGTYSAAWTQSTSSSYSELIFAYQPAAGAAPSAPPLERPSFLPLMAPQGGV